MDLPFLDPKVVEAMLMVVPAAIAIVRGSDHTFELVNPLYCAVVGRTAEELLGSPGRQALPELNEQGVWDLFDRIRASGERFTAQGFPVQLRRADGQLDSACFDWVGQPLPVGSGSTERIFIFAVEVTAKARAREQIEAFARAESAARHQAEAAGARLEWLTQLAFALAGTTTEAEVASVVVEQGMRRAQADTCALYSLEEAGDALVLLAHKGIAPELVERIRRPTASPSEPGPLETALSGAPLWVETEAQYVAIYPSIANAPATGRRVTAFWSIPLVVEGRPIGLLAMGYYAERSFSKGERTFVETFTNQCAQALLRAQRRERELAARRWLSTTLQSIGDGVIATDTAGRINFMNAVAERLTGWLELDAHGKPLEDVFRIFSEETRLAVESPVTKVLREGAAVGLGNHTVLRTRAGVDVPVDDSGAPIRDESGEILGVVLVFRDATEEKRNQRRRVFLSRAAEALASSLEYPTTLASVAQLAVPQLADWCSVSVLEGDPPRLQQTAVAHVDPSKVAYAVEMGRRYPPDPSASRGVPEVLRTGKSALFAEIPTALLESGAVDAEHLRFLRELKLESVMIVALVGRDGRSLGVMNFVYAASGRRYTEDDLAFAENFARHAALAIENARSLRQVESARAREQALRKEAELANTSKDLFLATVSHELRTPLNAILGWSVTLLRRQHPPEVARALAVIERNARTQTRLVEDLLDISRITSGKLILSLGPVDMSHVVQAAVEGIRPAADAKGIALSATWPPEPEALAILADVDRVAQILWNLLSNAVKFTPRGGSVAVAAARVGSDIAIDVSDTGEGIPPDVLPHVFDLFRQADSSTTRRHGGLGLGLSLVRQLVAAHGGTVKAKSAGPNQGTSIAVRLPARSSGPAVQNARGSVAAGVDAGPAPLTTRLDGVSVLVVDDEEDARELVSHVLSECGASVLTALSAADALSRLGAAHLDVIVSDVGMPGMDGYDFIRAVRTRPAEDGGGIPAIALTAYSRASDAKLAVSAGYQLHLAKPIDTSELALAVAHLARQGSR